MFSRGGSLTAEGGVLAKKKASNMLLKTLYNKRVVAEPNISKVRPSIASVLSQSLRKDFNEIVATAVGTGDLNRESLLEVLQAFRRYHRFDKVEALARACEKAKFELGKRHVSVIMACAAECGAWTHAIRHYQQFRERGGHSNVVLQNSLMAAYSRGGNWREAIGVYAQLVSSREADGVSMHTAMRCARSFRSWSLALQCFSAGMQQHLQGQPSSSSSSSASASVAVQQPTSLTYLELLRALETGAAYRLPGSWHYSLSVLSALVGSPDPAVKVTTGHYNAVLGAVMSCATPQRRECDWALGLAIIERMKQSNDVRPNNATLATVLDRGPIFAAPVALRLFKFANVEGLRFTAGMYRRLFLAFFCDGRYRESLTLAKKIVDRSIDDVGNPNVSLRELFLGLMDALLEAPSCYGAQTLLLAFEEQLQGVIGDATGGLGAMGLPHERWIVEGRVAVVDSFVLRSGRFPSLLERFDSIFVPFAVVREITRQVAERPEGAARDPWLLAHRHLRDLSSRNSGLGGGAVRLLPMLHQLHAHSSLLSGSLEASSVSLSPNHALLEGLKRGVWVTSEDVEQDLRNDAIRATEREETQRLREATAVSSQAASLSDVGLVPIRRSTDVVAMNNVSPSKIARRLARKLTSETASSAEASARQERQARTERRETALGLWTPSKSCVAVAAMLKRLSPDADVHVVSVCDTASVFAANNGVSFIKYRPEILRSKAPNALELKNAMLLSPQPTKSNSATSSGPLVVTATRQEHVVVDMTDADGLGGSGSGSAKLTMRRRRGGAGSGPGSALFPSDFTSPA